MTGVEMNKTRTVVLFAVVISILFVACDTSPGPTQLTLAQAIAALPTPAQLGRTASSGSLGMRSMAVHPFVAGDETPNLSTMFYVTGLANGGMDSICAAFYGEILHLLKGLSADDFAAGSHSFPSITVLGNSTVDASWSESGGAFVILVRISGGTTSIRARIDITQSDGQVNATMVIKVIDMNAYYATIYDQASGSCEIFRVGCDAGGVPTPDTYSLYVKNLRSAAHTLVGVVRRSASVDTLVTTVYADDAGSVGRQNSTYMYFDDNGVPFFETDDSTDKYRVASMTTYPDHLAYGDTNPYNAPNEHSLFYDNDGNGIFDGTDSDVPGGIGVGLYPLTVTEGGYIYSIANTYRPYLQVTHNASLPTGFAFDVSLPALRTSLDTGLTTYAAPYATALVSHAEAQARFVALIAQEEASSF
jgi:hypothetical protein